MFVHPVSVILAFTGAGEIDWAAPDFVGWYAYDFKDAAIILVPEWQTKSLKQGLLGEALPGVVHEKLAPRGVKEFRYAAMSRELAEAVWSCYKANGTGLKKLLLLAEQRTFARNIDTERTSKVTDEIDDDEDNWDFEGVVAAEKVAANGTGAKCKRYSASVRMASRLCLRQLST